MRFNLRLLLTLSAVFCYSVSAQGDISLPRGDSGRTGEFNVTPIESFGTVIWKSPKVASFDRDAQGHVSGRILGETVAWVQPQFGAWNRTGLPELRREENGFIASAYSLPIFGTGKESAPLSHRKNLFISLNLGPSSLGFKPSGDGFLISVDAATGSPNFVFKCGKCYVSNPVGYQDVIIITTQNIGSPRKGSVKAIDASTGKLEWSYPIQSSLVTPTVHEGVLYFLQGPSRPNAALAQSAETLIHAFDLRTQQIKWSFEAKGTFDTPAISEGVMFAASNRDYIYAIDLATGKEKWRFKAEASNPCARNGTVFFSDSSNLFSLDAASGALRWKTKIPGGVDQALAVSKSRVFFSSGNNRFHAVDSTSGQIAWSAKIEAYPYEPVISGNRVFAGGDRELLMFDTETGKKFETVKLGRDVAYTPVLQDGTAIIYNGDGYFFAMKK